MSVSDQSLYYAYYGDGVSTSFPYNCRILEAADLKVTVGGIVQTLATHYNVTGAGDAGGGAVQMLAAPASAVLVEIERVLSLDRVGDYLTAGDFQGPTVTKDLDRLCMLIQQVLFQATRAKTVVLADGAAGTVTVIEADGSSGPVNVELPASGEVLIIKTDATENAIGITMGTEGQTLTGIDPEGLTIQGESVRLLFSAATSTWYKIG